ncbi:hypothetical protein ACTXT7_003761 [Hymenolepis weldensis]
MLDLIEPQYVALNPPVRKNIPIISNNQLEQNEGIMMSQYFGVREVTLQAVFVIATVSAVGLTHFWWYKLYPNLAIRIRQNLRKPQEKNE